MGGKIIILVLGILQVSLSVSVQSKLPDRTFNVSSLIFPKGFIFSAATASYQVEGGWNAGGKGENIWDRLVHTNPGSIDHKDNGDVACDSYNKFKEDVQNLKTVGFKMYRFSLSWSRLFPKGFIGSGIPNPDGVRYYNALIDELLANGIEPMVTLFHWDLPQPLQDFGGWLNPDIADEFAEFSRACFELFGKKVKWWITINEAISITKGYGETALAPLLDYHGTGEYISAHNLLRAHAKAYKIYDKEFRATQNGKVSFILNDWFMMPKDPNNPDDVAAAERGNQFIFGWFGHPIYHKDGDYPPVMREYVDKNSKLEGLKKSRLPHFTPEEIADLKGSADYLALNHYSSMLATTGLSGADPSVYRDQEVIRTFDDSWPKSACPWLVVVPKGIKGIIEWIRKEYDDPEIFMTEGGYCGFADNDNDEARIDYFNSYFKYLVEAINEGAKVLGYNVWSIMDNFEWRNGFTRKLGIMKVDFNDPNRPRTFKSSATFLNQVIKQNS